MRVFLEYRGFRCNGVNCERKLLAHIGPAATQISIYTFYANQRSLGRYCVMCLHDYLTNLLLSLQSTHSYSETLCMVL